MNGSSRAYSRKSKAPSIRGRPVRLPAISRPDSRPTMRVVREPGPTIEHALRAGAIQCPDCRGVLRPWGMARERVIHVGDARDLPVRPRRARCAVCHTTHVLLPDWLLARRAYAARVIWRALVAHATGTGYRRIALRLRVPETTVRDWLRACARMEPRLVARLAGAGHTSSSAVLHLDRSTRPPAPWRIAARLTGGRLLVNTSPPRVVHGKPADQPP